MMLNLVHTQGYVRGISSVVSLHKTNCCGGTCDVSTSKKDSLRKSSRMGDGAVSVRTFLVDILEGTEGSYF